VKEKCLKALSEYRHYYQSATAAAARGWRAVLREDLGSCTPPSPFKSLVQMQCQMVVL